MKIKNNFLLKIGLVSLILSTPALSSLNMTKHNLNFDSNFTGLNAALNKIAKMDLAYAGSGTATFHLTNVLRAGIGMVVGYNDVTAYKELVCGSLTLDSSGNCEGPPHNGLVGASADIINQIKTTLISSGISSCAAIPSSGSITGTTIAFGTATHSVPSPWLNGGTAFTKRVTFTQTLAGDTAHFAYEFNCGDLGAGYVAINMVMNNTTASYSRLITIYTGGITATKSGIEVYMSEYNSNAQASRAADAMRIEYDNSTNIFNLWGIINHNLDTANKQSLNRVAIAGNYSTGIASVFSSSIALNSTSPDNPIDTTSLSSLTLFKSATGLTDGDGVDTAAPDFTTNINSISTADGTRFLKEGCINFSSPDTPTTSTAFCTGLTPVDIGTTTQPKPYIDTTTTGAFSMDWVVNTMPTKIENLP